jgi:outer membrane autotransporter protein
MAARDRVFPWPLPALVCLLPGLGLGSGPATAANDCGAPVMGVVTCAAPVMGQSFTDADGITYDAAGSDGLDITVLNGTTAEHVTLTSTNPDAVQAIANHGTVEQTATSTGTAVAGLYARQQGAGAGSVTIVNDGAVTTAGDGVRGLYGDVGDAHLTLESSGSVTVNGGNAGGLVARGTGGAIDITASGSIAINGMGANANAIFAQTDSGAIHIVTDATMNTGPAGGTGIRAFTVGSGAAVTLEMTGGSITTDGAPGIDIAAGAGHAVLTLDGAISLMSGGNGVQVSAIGGIEASLGGSVEADFGRALQLNAAGGSLSLTIGAGGSASGGGGQPTLALTAAAGITFDNAGEVVSDTLFLAADGPTTLRNDGILRGSSEMTNGNQVFENRAGGLVDLTRDTGVARLAFGDGNDLFDNQAGAALSLRSKTAGGDLFQATGLESFRNAGRVTLADLESGGMAADPGDVLELSGDYVSAGGTLALDVTLGGDGSAADLLRVGSTSLGGGPTLIEVVNAGGLGAATTTGIKLVEVTGESAAGAFALAAPVSAGGFDYRLVQGADGDWYLTTVDPLRDSPIQAFQGSGLLIAWRQGLGTLEERLGELRGLLGGASGQTAELGLADAGAATTGAQSGLWLRGAGAFEQLGSSTGQAFEQRTTLLQAGYDLGFRGAFGGDLLLAGAAATLTQATLESGDTSLDLTGYGGALYATWLAGPLHLDAVAKADAFSARQDDAGTSSRASGWVAGLSLEAGWRAPLGSGFFVEPQAQVSWATGDLGELTDALDREVAFDDLDSLTTRVGLDLGATLKAPGGVLLRPRLSADWIHEFLGESEAEALGLTAVSDLGGSRWRVGGGLAVLDLGGDFVLDLAGAYEAGDSGDAVRFNATLRLPL